MYQFPYNYKKIYSAPMGIRTPALLWVGAWACQFDKIEPADRYQKNDSRPQC